jgi:hypothetical protein
MFKNKRKLQLLATLATLFLLAFGVGCKGFFVNSPISSITINFTNGSAVELTKTTNLNAYAVNQDGSAGNLTTGVSWSNCVDTGDSTTIDGTVVGTGSAILTGVALGTCTITASSQSISGSATATIFITITEIAISPTSGSLSGTGGSATGNFAPFKVTANNGATDITNGASLIVSQSGTPVTTITCSYVAPSQICSAAAALPGTYQLVASYPGTALTATATLTVTATP